MAISKKSITLQDSRGSNIFQGVQLIPGGGGGHIVYSYRNLQILVIFQRGGGAVTYNQ